MQNPIIKWLVILSILWIDFVTIGDVFNFPHRKDPHLEEYVKEFVVDAEKHGVHVDPDQIGRLEYVMDIGGDDIGITYYPEKFGYQLHWPFTCKIQIKAGLHPPIYEKATVYHELGHCLLGLGHDSDPNQLMYWQIPDTKVIEANWESMLDHMFATPRR